MVKKVSNPFLTYRVKSDWMSLVFDCFEKNSKYRIRKVLVGIDNFNNFTIKPSDRIVTVCYFRTGKSLRFLCS